MTFLGELPDPLHSTSKSLIDDRMTRICNHALKRERKELSGNPVRLQNCCNPRLDIRISNNIYIKEEEKQDRKR